jgi:hypothetical protein
VAHERHHLNDMQQLDAASASALSSASHDDIEMQCWRTDFVTMAAPASMTQ